MKQIYMGIDPGKTGGIAFVTRGGRYLESIHMPLTAGKEIDVKSIIFKIDEIIEKGTLAFCFIEKIQYPPKQSVKSTCTTCTGYGRILTILDMMDIKYEEVAPLKWKRNFSLIKKPKKDSVATAQKLFPKAPKSCFYGPKGGLKDGVAEALLIAEYCRRQTK